MTWSPRIAVILPCYNEEVAIASVIRDFRSRLPEAEIHVFDNNSSDATSRVARAEGATVRMVRQQGKGHVMRRAFADVDADIYIMTDGDGTYDISGVRDMVDHLVEEDLDMIVGVRKSDEKEAYRRGHRIGNRLFNLAVRTIFGKTFTDIFSGYRVMSRRFVKSFPALSRNFEIETELSVHALYLNSAVSEVDIRYLQRPEGSHSKLRTYRDGFRIMVQILKLSKDLKPFQTFTMVSALLGLLSLGLGIPVVLDFLETGLVERLPTALLAASLGMMSSLVFSVGLVLMTVSQQGRELKRLNYNSYPSLLSRSRQERES